MGDDDKTAELDKRNGICSYLLWTHLWQYMRGAINAIVNN